MNAGSSNPEGPSLEAICAKYSASPSTARPIDALWQTYARNMARARRDFDAYFPEFTQPTVIDTRPDMKPLLHAKATNEDRELPGRLKVLAAYGGVVLACSAGNPTAERTYEFMQPKIQEVGRTALDQLVQSISERRIRGAGSALGLYLAANAADSQGRIPGLSPGIKDRRWPGYLKKRYPESQNPITPVGWAYAEVTILTGSLMQFYRNHEEPISRQHIRDFLDVCMRHAGKRELRDMDEISEISSVVARSLGANAGRMFYAGATLFHQNGLSARNLGHGNESQPTRANPIPRPRAYQPTPYSEGSHFGRSEFPRMLHTLLEGPIDDELDKVENSAVTSHNSYPWAMLYTALRFRKALQPHNRSGREIEFMMQNETAIAERAAFQLMSSDAPRIIARGSQVQPDYLGAAIELQPWLAQVRDGYAHSPVLNSEGAANILGILEHSLDTHLMKAYGVDAHDLTNSTYREALLHLGLFNSSRLREEPARNQAVMIGFYTRITKIMNGRIHPLLLPTKARAHYEELRQITRGWGQPRYDTTYGVVGSNRYDYN